MSPEPSANDYLADKNPKEPQSYVVVHPGTHRIVSARMSKSAADRECALLNNKSAWVTYEVRPTFRRCSSHKNQD